MNTKPRQHGQPIPNLDTIESLPECGILRLWDGHLDAIHEAKETHMAGYGIIGTIVLIIVIFLVLRFLGVI